MGPGEAHCGSRRRAMRRRRRGRARERQARERVRSSAGSSSPGTRSSGWSIAWKADSIVPVSAARKKCPPVVSAMSLSASSSRSARIQPVRSSCPCRRRSGKGRGRPCRRRSCRSGFPAPWRAAAACIGASEPMLLAPSVRRTMKAPLRLPFASRATGRGGSGRPPGRRRWPSRPRSGRSSRAPAAARATRGRSSVGKACRRGRRRGRRRCGRRAAAR
jgi:hypothetical protein